MSDSLQPHGLKHSGFPCPSPNSWSLLIFMSIKSVMPTNHLILYHPLLLPYNLSQHQGLFQSVNSSHQVAKVLESFTGEGNGRPLQYSCLENPMNRMKKTILFLHKWNGQPCKVASFPQLGVLKQGCRGGFWKGREGELSWMTLKVIIMWKFALMK